MLRCVGGKEIREEAELCPQGNPHKGASLGPFLRDHGNDVMGSTFVNIFLYIVILFTSKTIGKSNTFTQLAWLKDRIKQRNSKEKHDQNPIVSGAFKYTNIYKDTHIHTHDTDTHTHTHHTHPQKDCDST